MRIGILHFAHESNTFAACPTDFAAFERGVLLDGTAVRDRYANTHHELGGFFDVLANASVRIEPLFAAWALPAGRVERECYAQLLQRLMDSLDRCPRLDGLLVAPHGAMVSQSYADGDGHWLSEVRRRVGAGIPIIGTLDAHANLSPAIVHACDALIAYRTNPHLDQRDRGREAANLLLRTLRGEVRPTMQAAFPPLAINIERQLTSEPHWQPIHDVLYRIRGQRGVLSASALLGFPYADVPEMGSAVIAVTDDDLGLAHSTANDLARRMWQHRRSFRGELVGVQAALDVCVASRDRVCLLDMGDNVGGGSAADGTVIAEAIRRRRIPNAFVCLWDPAAVQQAAEAGIGKPAALQIGGKTDALHGPPLRAEFRVINLCEGRFSETKVRHGGIRDFDQGRTAILQTNDRLTVMVTSQRMVPFSLQQLISCGVDPLAYHVLVAKGVNAPVAAYQEVCQRFIRVNTPGSTCADMTRLPFRHRCRPLYPFEEEFSWSLGE